VTLEVVVSAALADQPAWRLRLRPAISIAPVPDAVLRTQGPFTALAVHDPQLADRRSEGTGVENALAAIAEKASVAQLSLRERVYGHRASI
jgi:hypothetical protein